jgi:hypothetical protein
LGDLRDRGAVSYAKQYTDAVQEYMELAQKKEQRKAEVRAEVRAEYPHMTDGSKLELVQQGRIASDLFCRDLQVQMDRAVAKATMFGMGAVIRNLAFLAKRGES